MEFLIYFVIITLIPIFASMKVRSTYSKYSKVPGLQVQLVMMLQEEF